MTGSAANASVNGTRGSFRLATGGDAHAAMLNGVAAANLSASVQFRATKPPTGGATTGNTGHPAHRRRRIRRDACR